MFALSAVPFFRPSGPAMAGAATPERLRVLLCLCCVASIGAAAVIGEPSALVQADPQLAFLLRGMALIKAAIVLPVIALLFWRFGHPASGRFALACIGGASVLAGSSMLIWQLTLIPLAAVALHVAAFVLLVAAWRDGGTAIPRFPRSR